MTERIGDVLALCNALLNGTAAVLLCLGFVMIRAGRRETHRTLMTSAFVVSAVFLASYLSRVALTGTHLYPGHGTMKAVYYSVLFSHMTLAAATPVLAIMALYFARQGRFAEHKRVTRWALPIWLYVSVTGVVVYVMLYHLA